MLMFVASTVSTKSEITNHISSSHCISDIIVASQFIIMGVAWTQMLLEYSQKILPASLGSTDKSWAIKIRCKRQH